MIKCPNCNAELKYSAGAKKVVCEYCNSSFDPEKLSKKVDVSKERNNTYKGKSYTCSQCGAMLLTFDETAITFCSYCGSQAMIESKMMEQNSPDFIIPFEVDKDTCVNNYKKVVSKAIFAPEYMKANQTIEKFRGIYMPYGIYKLDFKGVSKNKGSKYARRSGDYIIYNDYQITADADVSYDGISFDLLSKFYDNYSMAIPHNVKDKKAFNINYLSGYYADVLDVNGEVYDSEAEKIARDDTKLKLLKNKEFTKYGCSDPKIEVSVTDRKIGMFPVYFLAIRSKYDKTINYAVVNGQTGKVVADLPISFAKYILFSIILAAIIFLLIDNLVLLTPKSIAGFSILSGFVSLILSAIQLTNIKNKEYHKDDKGYNSIKGNRKRHPKEKVFRYVYKELIAIVIPTMALLINFVNDIYYYGASAIALILVILSFRDLVKEHNLLVSNKLPQLEKRGGDESD